MNRYLFDTDHLSLFQRGHSNVLAQCAAHCTDELYLSVISVEEQFSGWMARIRQCKDNLSRADIYEKWTKSITFLSRVPLLSFSLRSQERFDRLKALRLNVPRMDLRIASIALENACILVTRNLRDFQRVPGLILEDWSK